MGIVISLIGGAVCAWSVWGHRPPRTRLKKLGAVLGVLCVASGSVLHWVWHS